MNVSFPVILLFWALSLSPVWLNIEGWQDFSYKTQILFFYSENNSNSLNRPLNTNLIDVQWFMKSNSIEELQCNGNRNVASQGTWMYKGKEPRPHVKVYHILPRKQVVERGGSKSSDLICTDEKGTQRKFEDCVKIVCSSRSDTEANQYFETKSEKNGEVIITRNICPWCMRQYYIS